MLDKLRSEAGPLRSVGRMAVWLLAIGIVLLHVVPATHRPVTAVGHGLEHVGIFLLLGLAFGLGYPGRVRAVLSGLLVYCLTVEALQIAVPGRHPRLSDLLINTASALMGLAVAVVLMRVRARRRGEDKATG